ncbi:MAG: PEP-CTERM sorting domain-containing protein [Blastopirellula sp.]|nr:MAG: PEP-CTERM sorting domain-containing protein [Blastopirellula sp.]
MKRTIQLAVACVAVMFTVGQVQAEVIFSLNNPDLSRNNTWSFGEIFTVGGQDLTVNSLGAFDANGDGFVTSGGIPVGIYLESDQSLLVSTNVMSSDPLIGNFRFGDISPLTLLSGEQYRVVAVNRDDLYNKTVNAYDVSSLVSYDGYGYGQFANLTFSNVFTGGTNTHGVWMANLDASPSTVPEPTSLAIFGIGALCMGASAARRRRKEKQAAEA